MICGSWFQLLRTESTNFQYNEFGKRRQQWKTHCFPLLFFVLGNAKKDPEAY